MRYLEAVGRAGALAIVVPPMPGPAIPALLDARRRHLLSGGPDLHPDAYGAAPHAELGPTEPRLDAFELALARAADERDMPILAICRGMQVAQRRARRHAAPAPPRRRRRDGHPPPAGEPEPADPRRLGRGRQPPRRDPRAHRGAGELLPPPGVRRHRRAPHRHRAGRGRHRRGLRGVGPRLHGRRAVARRVPRGPRRAGGAVQRARRGVRRARARDGPDRASRPPARPEPPRPAGHDPTGRPDRERVVRRGVRRAGRRAAALRRAAGPRSRTSTSPRCATTSTPRRPRRGAVRDRRATTRSSSTRSRASCPRPSGPRSRPGSSSACARSTRSSPTPTAPRRIVAAGVMPGACIDSAEGHEPDLRGRLPAAGRRSAWPGLDVVRDAGRDAARARGQRAHAVGLRLRARGAPRGARRAAGRRRRAGRGRRRGVRRCSAAC